MQLSVWHSCQLLGADGLCVRGQVHAENGDAVFRAQKKAFEEGITGPEGHYISRPDTVEVSSPLSPCCPVDSFFCMDLSLILKVCQACILGSLSTLRKEPHVQQQQIIAA